MVKSQSIAFEPRSTLTSLLLVQLRKHQNCDVEMKELGWKEKGIETEESASFDIGSTFATATSIPSAF
jgi:hypothetical protein